VKRGDESKIQIQSHFRYFIVSNRKKEQFYEKIINDFKIETQQIKIISIL